MTDLQSRIAPTEPSDPMGRSCLAVIYTVAATSYEQLCIWSEFSEEGLRLGNGHRDMPRVLWVQEPRGFWQVIGHFGKRPVAVSVSFARVLGHIIAFYDATSQVVDHLMVRAWVDKAFPNSKGHSDAINFGNVIHELRRLP